MMMSFIMATLMAMPVKAQDVIEGDVVEPQDDTEVTDSTMLDSLAADTLKLPWPESVQVGIGKLLESKMFETSQVGIIYQRIFICLFMSIVIKTQFHHLFTSFYSITSTTKHLAILGNSRSTFTPWSNVVSFHFF